MAEVLSNPSVLRVRAALETAGIAAAIIELPGAARTAQAAADFLDCDVGQIAISGVWAAAGHPHTVFRLSYEDLLRITGGLAVEVAA